MTTREMIRCSGDEQAEKFVMLRGRQLRLIVMNPQWQQARLMQPRPSLNHSSLEPAAPSPASIQLHHHALSTLQFSPSGHIPLLLTDTTAIQQDLPARPTDHASLLRWPQLPISSDPAFQPACLSRSTHHVRWTPSIHKPPLRPVSFVATIKLDPSV